MTTSTTTTLDMTLIWSSVRFREPRVNRGFAVALDAPFPRGRCARERHVADRRLGFRLDVSFARRSSAPRRDDEPGTTVHDLLELVVRIGFRRVLGAERDRAVEERLLNRDQELFDVRGESLHRHERLLPRIATRQDNLRLLDVFRTDLHAQWHTTHFPFIELPTRRL